MTPRPVHPPRTARRTRRILLALLAVALLVLLLAPAAFAAAGGGTYGFGGGSGGGGFSGGGGHGHSAFEIYIVVRLLIAIARIGHGLGLVVLIALGLAYWFFRKVAPRMRDSAEARRQRGHADTRSTRRRARRVELAAAEAADEDPMFDPEHVKASAGSLFTQIQFAWSADDRMKLRGLVAPDLLSEWERRLDDFDRQGWRNRVEPLGPPQIEYVGITRRGGAARVTVRVEARMRDYVVDASGRHIKRRGQFTETVRLREFWTLERREDHWVLASIEQGAEGAHTLKERIAPTEWSDEQALRDEALIEQAVADAPPATTRTAELADLDFSGDARAAANDLSLADGRFAPDVLEAAARQAVQAWLEAVDGPDAPLRRYADPSAVEQLLYAGDQAHRTRLVVRGAHLRRIGIVALDAATEPATMTIDVDLEGRRYLEDRSTTQVLGGDPNRATRFTERWTLAVQDDPRTPWRITAVRIPTPKA